MKTLKRLALLILILTGLQQNLQAQCQASFTYYQIGNTVTFTNTSSGNFTAYSWWMGNGSTSSMYNPVFSYSSPGVYGVCLSVWDTLTACQSVFCDTIVIGGSGCSAQFSYIDSGLTVYFTPSIQVGYQYSWTFGDGTSSNVTFDTHTYPAPGTYTACLIVSQNGVQCGSSCMNITVSGATSSCDASFTTVDSAGYTYFIADTYNANWDYIWDYGDGTSGSGNWSMHQYTGSGPWVACLTVIDSSQMCADYFCDTIYGSGSGNCSASISYQAAGNLLYFIPNTTGGVVTSYQWSFGDGTTALSQFPHHLYTAVGSYTVCLTITTASGCTDSTCQTITINSSAFCDASFITSDSAGYTYFLANNYNGNWDYIWQYGDGTSGTGDWSVHQYNGPGPWIACLTVIDSAQMCTDSHCDTIYTNGSGGCQAQMSISQLSTYGFYFQSNNSNVSSVLWNFGDGTTSSTNSLIHSYTAAGTYYVCLTVQFNNGCTSTVCDTVVVFGSGCQAYFNAAVQSNNIVSFSNLSAGSSQATYSWSFGDGYSSNFTSPNHYYASPGIYYVCLSMIDSLQGCADTYCDTVVVNASPNCNAGFQAFDSLNTWFFYPAVGNYTNYYWTFGDGTFSTATYPTHVYSGTGLFTVCLVVTDSSQGCSSTYCDSIYIPNTGGCQAYFTAFPDSNSANTWQFLNGSSGNFTTLVWSFGDGTSSTNLNPLHAYANPGTYYACLTIYGSGCQDSYCDTIVVGSGSNCIPNFFAMPDTVFGNGNVTFYIYNNCPGWQYVWNFGDSTTGSGTGPFIHNYSSTGWYVVCVTAYDSLGNAITWCDSVYAYRIGTVGLSEMNNAIPVNVFPNPSNGDFSVRFALEAASPLTIEVLSIEGKILWRTEQEHPSGLSEIRLDQSVLESGVYILRLRNAEQQTLTRFSIQH